MKQNNGILRIILVVGILFTLDGLYKILYRGTLDPMLILGLFMLGVAFYKLKNPIKAPPNPKNQSTLNLAVKIAVILALFFIVLLIVKAFMFFG